MSEATTEATIDPDRTWGAPLLSVTDLVKHYPVTAGVLRRQVGAVRAVDGVSLELHERETLAIVGESGSGKSTLGRTLLRLETPTSGTVHYRGEDLMAASRPRLRELRRHLQIVFQDPYTSLNPRMPVGEIVAEPLRIHGTSARDARHRAGELLTAVGLGPSAANHYPHEFSGGQRQRIGIARAISVDPDVLVLDEPVSALDVSVQAQVLELLTTLRDERGLSYLFIGHDLAVVRAVADRVGVMYLGQIVELADTEDLFRRAAHPYTHALLSAVPVPDPLVARNRERIVLHGEQPDASNPPPGCRFHTRCPLAEPVCRTDVPPLLPVGAGQWAACHFALGPDETLAGRIARLH